MNKARALVALLVLAGCTREKIVYRDNPTAPTAEATPAPLPPSLKFPQGIPDHDISIIPGLPTLGDVVNQEIVAMFPGCEVNTRCDGQGYSAQSFFNVLNSRLRARGYWAGQHGEGVSDEIAVGTSCTGEWQNYHAWYYGSPGYPIWANMVSSPCAGEACLRQSTSYRGNTIIPASYCTA